MTNVTCPHCGSSNITENLSFAHKDEHTVTANLEEAEISDALIVYEIACLDCKTLTAYTTILNETFMYATSIKQKAK